MEHVYLFCWQFYVAKGATEPVQVKFIRVNVTEVILPIKE